MSSTTKLSLFRMLRESSVKIQPQTEEKVHHSLASAPDKELSATAHTVEMLALAENPSASRFTSGEDPLRIQPMVYRDAAGNTIEDIDSGVSNGKPSTAGLSNHYVNTVTQPTTNTSAEGLSDCSEYLL